MGERQGLVRFVCEQPPYSIFVRHVEYDVLPVAQRYGMGVIVWSPLAGGWLSGKYCRGQEEPPDSRAARYRDDPDNPLAKRTDASRPGNQRKLDLVEDLNAVADEAGLSLSHMSIAFALAHPAVTSTIIGPPTPEQLDEMLKGVDERLDEDTLDAIDQIVEPGSVIERADRGWFPPWMKPEERRQ